jgi:hypothetical protein
MAEIVRLYTVSVNDDCDLQSEELLGLHGSIYVGFAFTC